MVVKEYSNTTLVKVKFKLFLEKNLAYLDSNTTLVKVKFSILKAMVNPPEFKYNTC